MQPFSDIAAQTNQTAVSFLFTELSAGLTFLDVANATTNSRTAIRNRNHAHEAYRTILRFAPRVRLEGEDKLAFDDKLFLLKERLIDAGYSV